MRPIPLAAALPLLLAAGAAEAQSTADLDARVRALEARVAALEGAGPAAAPAPTSNAVRCKRLNVNGAGFTPATVLTVTVNGTVVGTFSANTYADLERRMRPGPNRVGLAFAAAGTTGTQADLRCLAPEERASRDMILSLQPTRDRLSAEVDVEFVPG